jgi:hypothetical protein
MQYLDLDDEIKCLLQIFFVFMGSKGSTSFRIPTETFNGDCVQVTIMYVVFSSTGRSYEWAALDLWPAKLSCLVDS